MHARRPGRCWVKEHDLNALTTDAAGELHILGHDSNALGMERAKIRVLEKSNKMRLTSFLRNNTHMHARARGDRKTLESDIIAPKLDDNF